VLTYIMDKVEYMKQLKAPMQKKAKTEAKEEVEEKEFVWTPNVITSYTGAPPNMHRKDLQKFIDNLGVSLAFLDVGADGNGYIRWRSPEDAALALSKSQTTPVVAEGQTLTMAATTGDEEKAFWSKMEASMKRKQSARHRGGSQRGGSKRGRRH